MAYRKIETSEELIYINEIDEETHVVIRLSEFAPEIGIEYIEGGEEIYQEEYDEIAGEVYDFLRVGSHPPHSPR